MHSKYSLLFTVVILCISSSSSKPFDRHRSYGHNTIADYMLKKFATIVQWLDNANETTAFDYIYQVNHGAGLNLFQGDIKGYNPRLRTAVRDQGLLWNTRQVPYIIDSTYNAKERNDIMDAIEEYKQKTCIRFVPKTTETDYVVFKQISGCYSTIGRIGGEQEISLVGPCLRKGTAVHEMMHALGFWHEHSRPDRDSWVHIIYDDIQKGKENNFDKLSVDEVDTLGVEYDYSSVMHYSKYSFSKNGSPTILPRDINAQIGQRIGLSKKDALKVNKLYHCDDQPHMVKPTQAIVAPTKLPVSGHQAQTTMASRPHQPALVTPAPATASPPKTTARVQTYQTVSQLGWTSWSSFSPCDLNCHHYRTRFCLSMDLSRCQGKRKEVETCGAPCKPAVSLGCWEMDPQNLSIPSIEGRDNSLMDNYKIRVAALRKCSNVASVEGYLVFALIDDGKCLTGPHAQNVFNKNGVSSGCGFRGKGGMNEANVYSFQKDIDGGWGLWTSWGQCLKTCGGGKQYRYRRCDSPSPMGHGKQCIGGAVQEQQCNSQECPGGARCGTRFHTGVAGTSGVIHILDYDNYMNCEYHIMTANPDWTISVAVTRIDVEYSKGCIYDALMIFDGNSDGTRMVGAYCGKQLPGTFRSTTNNVYIHFKSDATTTASGYTIHWSINSKTRKACEQPRTPAHAMILGTGNLADDKITIRCNPGFHLVGTATIRCIDQPTFALWSDSLPMCTLSRKRSVVAMRLWTCTFEESLCGMKNEEANDFNWIVTQSKEKGRFLHVESNRLQNIGDKGRIATKIYQPSHSMYCLSFSYRLSGDETTQLNLFMRQISNTEDLLLYTKSGSEFQDEGWQKMNVTVKSPHPFKILFEGEISEKINNYISLDDIRLVEGQC